MIGDILQPTHLLFVLIVALLVLGPKRLPEMARSLGSGMRDFKSAISGEMHDDDGQSGIDHLVGETPPPTVVADDSPQPEMHAYANAGYEPTYETESTATYEPEPTTVEQPADSDLANLLGPVPEPPEPHAEPAPATPEPAASVSEHHEAADATSPEPTEVHAPAGSPPDSA